MLQRVILVAGGLMAVGVVYEKRGDKRIFNNRVSAGVNIYVYT